MYHHVVQLAVPRARQCVHDHCAQYSFMYHPTSIPVRDWTRPKAALQETYLYLGQFKDLRPPRKGPGCRRHDHTTKESTTGTACSNKSLLDYPHTDMERSRFNTSCSERSTMNKRIRFSRENRGEKCELPTLPTTMILHQDRSPGRGAQRRGRTQEVWFSSPHRLTIPIYLSHLSFSFLSPAGLTMILSPP